MGYESAIDVAHGSMPPDCRKASITGEPFGHSNLGSNTTDAELDYLDPDRVKLNSMPVTKPR